MSRGIESLAWHPDALDPAGAVEVRWLGTAGFALRHDGHTLLIDPYLTRASLRRCIFSALSPDLAAIERHAPEADAIVVGHTHFDHALDVPAIARRTGARVFGSRSALTLCRAAGVPEGKLTLAERGAGSQPLEAEVGPFRLRFAPSAHSRLFAGRVPFPGDIEGCDDVPLRVERYRCGAVFRVEIEVAGRRIAHVGSAELVEQAGVKGDLDLVLLCVAGWGSSERFPERVVRALSPRAVLLSHWDDFFRPIDQPARPLPRVRIAALADRLARASRDTRIGTLPLLGRVRV